MAFSILHVELFADRFRTAVGVYILPYKPQKFERIQKLHVQLVIGRFCCYKSVNVTSYM